MVPLAMAYYTKYHVKEQSAGALLGPLRDSVLELERRARHYVERVNLEPGAAEALNAAHQALATARKELERLQQAAGQRGRAAAGRKGSWS